MKNKLSYLVALLCVVSSCTTDIDFSNLSTEVGYNTALVIPVGTVHATIDKVLTLVGDDVIKKDAELNTCYLWWNDSIIINTTNINIADFTEGKELISTFDLGQKAEDEGFPVPGMMPAGSYSFPLNFPYDFDYDDYDVNNVQTQRVDSVIISSARLYLKVNATDVPLAAYPVTMKVEFPAIPELSTLNFIIDHDGQEINEQLGNFIIRFRPDSTLTPLKVTYTFTSDGSLPIASTSKITTHTQFQIIDCTKAWGFFNKKNVITHDDVVQNIPTDFFESSLFKDNSLLFTNPLIDFRIMNDVGIPMDFEVEHIKAVDKDGQERLADFNGSPNCVIRLEKPQTEGGFSENWAHFNKTYGRTDRLFEITPAKFEYKFNVSVSNFKNVWEQQHYIYFPPTINMYVTAKLPFQFNPTTYYAYNDTLAADIETLTGVSAKPTELTVNNLNVHFKSTNKLPVKAVATAIFLDASDQEIYRQEGIDIASGVVNSEGIVTTAVKSNFSIKFVESSIISIWKTKKIVLSVRVDGQDINSLMNFQLNDELTTSVSLYIKGGIKTDLDTVGNIFK